MSTHSKAAVLLLRELPVRDLLHLPLTSHVLPQWVGSPTIRRDFQTLLLALGKETAVAAS
ncbi:SJCHGC07392 protein [Anopheles sinensis]|uniref:SJCHGC07392 protein n=1 Tax=Anopheles sinensis TaxID=74873 RepID=A0A084WC09_ANOSI|nr:SJCHGC07392 protein [Anopheles sinensis]